MNALVASRQRHSTLDLPATERGQRKPFRLWWFALLAILSVDVGKPLLATEAQQEGAEQACKASTETEGFTPRQWLAFSHAASGCLSYRARAVTIDAADIRTLALVQQSRNGLRQQVVHRLDGPSANLERLVPMARLQWPMPEESAAQSSSQAWAHHLSQHYRIDTADMTRIAGRDAMQLTLTPHDRHRRAREWWVDRQTGLLLKQQVHDSEGNILETFQITELQQPVRHQAQAPSSSPLSSRSRSFPGWLPEGFIVLSQSSTPSTQHFVASDGIASVSVFVGPADDPEVLMPGVHRIGLSSVVVRQFSLPAASENTQLDTPSASQEHQTAGIGQVVAVGDLPPSTLRTLVARWPTAPESGL